MMRVAKLFFQKCRGEKRAHPGDAGIIDTRGAVGLGWN